MSSPLREILASFGFDVQTKELKHGESLMHGMIDTVGSFAKLAAGAFVVGEIKEFVEGIVHAGDELEATATRMGLTTDALQQLRFAASTTNVEAGEFDIGLTKLQRNMVEASEGNKTAAAAFKKLGVDVKDSNGRLGAVEDILGGVADGFVGVEDPAERTAIAMALFGKSGTKLIPLLLKGKEGLAELREEAVALGGGLSEEAVQAAAELEEQQKKLAFSTLALKSQFAREFFPILIKFMQGAIKVSRHIAGWTKNTKLLQAVSIGLARTAVVAFVVKLTAALGGLRAMMFKTLLPFLILEDLLVFFAGGKSAIGEMMDRGFGAGTQDKVRGFFTALKNGNDEALDDMADAIRAKYGGTWAAVFESTRLGIQALVGHNDEEWTAWFLRMSSGWGIFFGDLVQFGKDNWNAFMAWMTNAVIQTWNNILENVAKFADKIPGMSGLAETARGNKSGRRLGNQFMSFDDVVAERQAREGSAKLGARADEMMRANGGAGVGRVDWEALANSFEGGPMVPFASARAGGAPVSQTVTQENNIVQHFNLPPGSDDETARRAGEGGAKGATAGLPKLQATMEALVAHGG